ncbi:MAG: pyridoxamine 5'-phosphate oxidase family protein [Anaerolineales bacterium]|nr:pyridoxamine 5'-phosphate oxidase family protein [Anaerolineales bacterium]
MTRRNPARWRAIEARLGREATIWVATVRYDGRPHLTPVWYIWLNEKIYISIGSETQKFVNLTANQSISLALPDTDSVIIIEGEAHVADWQTVDVLADYFYHKYEWDFRYDDSADWRLVEVTPHKMLAWGDGYEAEGVRVL